MQIFLTDCGECIINSTHISSSNWSTTSLIDSWSFSSNVFNNFHLAVFELLSNTFQFFYFLNP